MEELIYILGGICLFVLIGISNEQPRGTRRMIQPEVPKYRDKE